MKTVLLGNTQLEISKLGMGGAPINSKTMDKNDLSRTVQRAMDLGVNYFDTAPGYADSETFLGGVLREIKRPYVISTKLGGRPLPFNAQDRKSLEASFEESLRNFGRDYIDILFIHEPERPGQFDWWTDFVKVEGPVLDFARELKERGRIRYLGVGGTTAYEMAYLLRGGKFDVVLTAFNYSLLWQEAAIEVIPIAKERGIGIVLGSPLQQGALARKFDAIINDESYYWLSKPRREQFRRLYRLVDDCGIPLPELAIRFTLSNPAIDCILMGAKSAAEVESNAQAIAKGVLPPDLLKKIGEIAAMVPFRPFCEPFNLGKIFENPSSYKGPGRGTPPDARFI
jgi:aryl-alcohol dehydrogenase-like predicted oxidoreductase